MFTSLRIFGSDSWQEVREKETGRKAETQVMNFGEPSRHAAAPASYPVTSHSDQTFWLCPDQFPPSSLHQFSYA